MTSSTTSDQLKTETHETASDFTYGNRTGRGPGRTIRAMRMVLPGVKDVWGRVEPLAEAWRAHNVVTLGQPGRRWFALGDSLTQGVGASALDAGWVGQLAKRLADTHQDLKIINLSATGARVGDVLRQQVPVLELIGVSPDDLVTLMVGSNDLFGSRARRDMLPETFHELIDRLPVGSVVATLPHASRSATQVNDDIEAAANAGRIVMADLRVTAPTSWRGRRADDFFHPNDAGYAAIATALEPTLRAAVLSQQGDIS